MGASWLSSFWGDARARSTSAGRGDFVDVLIRRFNFGGLNASRRCRRRLCTSGRRQLLKQLSRDDGPRCSRRGWSFGLRRNWLGRRLRLCYSWRFRLRDGRFVYRPRGFFDDLDGPLNGSFFFGKVLVADLLSQLFGNGVGRNANVNTFTADFLNQPFGIQL